MAQKGHRSVDFDMQTRNRAEVVIIFNMVITSLDSEYYLHKLSELKDRITMCVKTIIIAFWHINLLYITGCNNTNLWKILMLKLVLHGHAFHNRMCQIDLQNWLAKIKWKWRPLLSGMIIRVSRLGHRYPCCVNYPKINRHDSHIICSIDFVPSVQLWALNGTPTPSITCFWQSGSQPL